MTAAFPLIILLIITATWKYVYVSLELYLETEPRQLSSEGDNKLNMSNYLAFTTYWTYFLQKCN